MSLIRFDHAVLLANEERRARDFYVDYLGAEVEKTFVRNREGRELHRSFLGLCAGMGLALFEDQVAVPPPRVAREWPAVVFHVPAAVYDRVVAELDGVSVDLAVPGAGATFYTHDTEGNAIGFSVADVEGPRLLRLEFDCPRLEEGVKFYGDVFALGSPESGLLPGGQPYAWFGLGSAGQGLLVVEHPDAPGANPGQHFAFLVAAEEHMKLKAQLEDRGGKEVPGHEGPRPEGEISTYMRDPWGRKLQWITHAEMPEEVLAGVSEG
jgi:catechol 2,3-dioxygenase-like lactoylglutathione lyase family enzyme/predicted enzyme related to lactoylglutathione lyase